jgi:hypothetical protein
MWKSSKVEATGYTPRGCIPINAVPQGSEDIQTLHQSNSCHITFEHSTAETTTVGQGNSDFEKLAVSVM